MAREINLVVFRQDDGSPYFDISTTEELETLLRDINGDGFKPRVFPMSSEQIHLATALTALESIDSAHNETMADNNVSIRQNVFYGLLQEVARAAYEAGREDQRNTPLRVDDVTT